VTIERDTVKGYRWLVGVLIDNTNDIVCVIKKFGLIDKCHVV